jgi:hypothetical protein
VQEHVIESVKLPIVEAGPVLEEDLPKDAIVEPQITPVQVTPVQEQVQPAIIQQVPGQPEVEPMIIVDTSAPAMVAEGLVKEETPGPGRPLGKAKKKIVFPQEGGIKHEIQEEQKQLKPEEDLATNMNYSRVVTVQKME